MKLKLKPALSTLAALLLGLPAFAQELAPAPSEPATVADADTKAEEEEGEDEPACDWLNRSILGSCFSERTGIKLYGWANGGTTIANVRSSDLSPMVFNDQKNDFMLNQAYLVLDRVVDTECDKVQLGGRLDVLYGTDARTTYALGLDTGANSGAISPSAAGSPYYSQGAGFAQTPRVISTDNSQLGYTTGGYFVGSAYGVALPQAYANVYLPFGNGIDVKLGHFYTVIGYEVVTAPDNFFYSHVYTMNYGEPFTHTGALATVTVNDKLSVLGGINRGWDNFSDNNNAVSFQGGYIFKPTEDISLAQMFQTGPEQDEGAYAGGTWQAIIQRAGTTQSLWRSTISTVAQMKFGCEKKWSYVFHNDLSWQNIDAAAQNAFVGGRLVNQYNWYAIAQYLTYSVNDQWSVGARFEWFVDEDGYRLFTVPTTPAGTAGTRVFGTRYTNFDLTFGAIYKPHSCVQIRPNVRYDWQGTGNAIYNSQAAIDTAGGAGNGSAPRFDMLTGSLDFIVKF